MPETTVKNTSSWVPQNTGENTGENHGENTVQKKTMSKKKKHCAKKHGAPKNTVQKTTVTRPAGPGLVVDSPKMIPLGPI